MIKITFENGEEYTEEQYKKDYVRMMDSIRTEGEDIGKKTCSSVCCDECPMYKKTCSNDHSSSTQYLAFSSIKSVHDWAKKHPVYTNRDKLIKTFGNKNFNFILSSLRNDMIDEYGVWLREEYQEPKKGEKEQ